MIQTVVRRRYGGAPALALALAPTPPRKHLAQMHRLHAAAVELADPGTAAEAIGEYRRVWFR